LLPRGPYEGMTIKHGTRRLLMILSACGFATSVVVYVASFSGLPVDAIFPVLIPLFLGWIVTFVPMYVLEYPASRSPIFFWKFARGMPGWVAPCGAALSVIAMAHLAWFGAHSGLGVPAIVDGQYVLDNHGRILKVLTRTEYLTLTAAALRAFASFMISFYFAPVAYWWFRRNDREADRKL
jgi:hypothetical protein